MGVTPLRAPLLKWEIWVCMESAPSNQFCYPQQRHSMPVFGCRAHTDVPRKKTAKIAAYYLIYYLINSILPNFFVFSPKGSTSPPQTTDCSRFLEIFQDMANHIHANPAGMLVGGASNWRRVIISKISLWLSVRSC